VTPEQRASRQLYRLGREDLERGDPEGALARLEALPPQCRRWADVHYLAGLAHERRGDLDAAARALEEALHINPGYAEALAALASVYEARGEFARSEALAERAQPALAADDGRLDPTTRGKLANLHAAVGHAYREVGEWREAIDAYRKAVDRCPEFPDLRLRLAATLRDAGYPDQALRELERVRRAHPHLLDAAVQLGLTWFSLGRTERAVAEWDAVLQRDPSRDDARMYLRLVRPPRKGGRSCDPRKGGRS